MWIIGQTVLVWIRSVGRWSLLVKVETWVNELKCSADQSPCLDCLGPFVLACAGRSHAWRWLEEVRAAAAQTLHFAMLTRSRKPYAVQGIFKGLLRGRGVWKIYINAEVIE